MAEYQGLVGERSMDFRSKEVSVTFWTGVERTDVQGCTRQTLHTRGLGEMHKARMYDHIALGLS